MYNRLSAPYVPPVTTYISLDNVIKKHPHYGYQLYFANEESTKEIEHNVSYLLYDILNNILNISPLAGLFLTPHVCSVNTS